jgi:hypothetical protein
MNELSKNEKGFSVVVFVLVAVLVAAISTAGWLVYRGQHKINSSANSTTSDSKSGTADTTETPKSTPATSSTIVTIPELGIKIVNIPTDISSLAYEMASKTGALFTAQAGFSTKSLMAEDPSCSSGSIGNLFRAQGMYDSAAHQGPFTFVKQFDGFWIAYKGSGVPCSQNSTTLDLQISQNNTFGEVIADPLNLEPL